MQHVIRRTRRRARGAFRLEVARRRSAFTWKSQAQHLDTTSQAVPWRWYIGATSCCVHDDVVAWLNANMKWGWGRERETEMDDILSLYFYTEVDLMAYVMKWGY